MGFLGLGRSKLKSEDPQKRLAALRALDAGEQGKLLDLALADPDAGVRHAAASRVTDPDRLDRLATASDPEVAAIGKRKLATIAVDEALKRPLARAQSLLAQITQTSGLEELALKAQDPAVRRAALDRLLAQSTSESALKNIAIQDQGDLARLAVEKIGKRALLKEVAKNAKQEPVRTAAERLITALDNERDKPSREKQRKERARRLDELVESGRALALSLDFPAAEARFAELTTQASAIAGEYPDIADEPGVEDRTRALARSREQLSERKRQAEAEIAAKAIDSARRFALLDAWAKRLETEDLSSPSQREDLASELRGELAAIGDGAAADQAELQRRIDVLRERLKASADLATGAAAPVRPHELSPETLAEIERLVARAEELSLSTSWREADQEYKGLDKKWRVVAGDLGNEDPRRKRFLDAFIRFKDRRRLNREDMGKVRSERLAVMRTLVGEAEALAAAVSGAVDVQKHQQALKDLQQRWREIGPVPPQEAHPLREAFRAAIDTAYAPVRATFEERDWERFANVQRAEELITAAQALAAAEATDPAQLAKDVKNFQQEWKDLGRLPRERNDDLWGRFKTACDAAYEKLKPFFAQRDAERGENLTKKEALIADLAVQVEEPPMPGLVGAEAMAADMARLDKVKAIQEKWKTIGPVPREKDQELWGRYKSLLDRFFVQRRARREELDKERGENLNRKEALITRVETLANELEKFKAGTKFGSKNEADFFADLRSLQAEWRGIGHVPRETMEDVRTRYQAAGDRVFKLLEDWFAKQDGERKGNLEAKQALIKQLEDLLTEQRPDWFKEDLRRIQDAWREIGPVPRDAMDINMKYRDLVGRILDAGRDAVSHSDGGAVTFGSADPLTPPAATGEAAPPPVVDESKPPLEGEDRQEDAKVG